MRLTFTANDYLNTSMRDEHGETLYVVSTTGAQTIIRKVNGGESEEVATIKWKWLSDDRITFRGKEIDGKQLLATRSWSSSRTFVGQDRLSYKWKILDRNCWLKRADLPGELAKYHKRNFGIMSPSHPPYLDISASLHHMVDEVVVTFVYAEKLSQRRESDNAVVMAPPPPPTC